MAGFLFDKLLAASGSVPGGQPLSQQEAVLRQLAWLVSSREWLAEKHNTYLIDVAMPNPVSLAGLHDVQFYAERLRRLILRYEPRLTDMQIELEPTGRALSPFRVRIQARFHGLEAHDQVFFDSNEY